jgi:two-component sensor histidine kinase
MPDNIAENNALEAISRINNELVNTQRELAKTAALLASANSTLQTNLREKDTLLKELQHRVKNNLQVVASLLRMQSARVKDPEDARLFTESQDRIRSMSMVYERLYRSDNLSCIGLREYVGDLASELVRLYSFKPQASKLITDIKDIKIDPEVAIPCGLIINEAISNSLKYAFPDGGGGTIRIAIKKTNGFLEMVLGDDGVGLPEALYSGRDSSLGMQLIHSLAEYQLGGNVKIERSGGTKYRIVFPMSKS